MNKVLNFHLVDNIDWFDQIIAKIKGQYNMVDIDTLIAYYNQEITLKNACHITIDDGDQTFYNIIYPVLKKYKVPASLYVSPKIFNEGINYWFQEVEGYDEHILKLLIARETKVHPKDLDSYDVFTVLKSFEITKINHFLEVYRQETQTQLKPYQNMTIAQLKEVEASGLITIGAHTMNHPILQNENEESCAYEINESIKDLSKILGHPIKCFTYPNGIYKYDFTEREENLLLANDIKICFSTITKNFNVNNNIMRVPRIGISNNENMLFLNIKLFLGSFWDQLKKIKSTGEYKQRKQLQFLFNGKK
jgi:peptidoglycan/xylan/chitin deacetylase (PgdA/CDA1 family)